MIKVNMIAAVVLAASLTVNAQTMEFKTQADSVSYAIGISVGANLKQSGIDNLNVDLISKGMAASLKGETAAMDPATAGKIINEHMSAMQAKKGAAAKEKGTKFLEENKKKKGITTLPSGLQYEVIKAGTGAKPVATDKVKVHYTGTLVDGTEFESSLRHGEPATFNLNQVIKGWSEALQLMPVGSKWKIYIPSDLAYGDRGSQKIGPGETLIFELELLEIVKQ